MRHALAARVLGIAAVSAIALPIVAPVASAAPASARSSLVKAVTKADVQAKKLITLSRSCPAAASQRSVTMKVRSAQTRGLAKASPTSLRLRQMRIRVHTQRLAVALSRCSGFTGAPGAPGASTPAAGSRGLQGAPGAPGPSGPSGTQIASIPLDALGQTLNAASLLAGGVLPASIPVLDVSSLATAPACALQGTACLGLDRVGVGQALTDAVGERVHVLPLLGFVLNPLLAQAGSALAGADPASLIDVQPTGDTTFVVTPTAGTPLASLLNLLDNTGDLPSDPLGVLQVRP